MPRGDKSKYTDKQKRKAEHIAEGYRHQGVPKDEAKARAWATVNKESGGGNLSGSGRGVPDTNVSSRKGGRIGGAGARGGAIGFTVGAGVCGGSGVISPNGIGRVSAVRVHIGSGTCADRAARGRLGSDRPCAHSSCGDQHARAAGRRRCRARGRQCRHAANRWLVDEIVHDVCRPRPARPHVHLAYSMVERRAARRGGAQRGPVRTGQRRS